MNIEKILDRQLQLPIHAPHYESEVNHMRKSKEYRFVKPELHRLGTVFPIKVTSTNNDGTFNGIFDFDRMNAVKHILATKYI